MTQSAQTTIPMNTTVKGIESQEDEMVSYVYTSLPANAIVRLPHPPSGDSQGQERFLAPSAEKQTRNYDAECSNLHLSLSTLKSKELSRSKIKL